MKLSIIIPVYNVEKYVSRCLDSVFQQDIPYSEYEVIVVNDGSSDNSAAIVAEYEKKYPNIVHIIKENGGPSSARNEGLKVAKGEYIWFVDADDWIQINCFKNLLEYAYNNDLDFCEFGYTEVFSDTRIVSSQNRRLYRHTTSNIDYISKYAVPYGACFNIFKRQIITDNNLYFIDGIFHEDREFNIRLLEHCNKISFYDNIPTGLYYYIREREDSTMSNINVAHTIKRINSYIKILQATTQNFPYNKKIKNYAYYVQHLINDIIAYSLVELIHNSTIENKAKFYKKMMRENSINYRLDVLSGKTKLKFGMLSLVKNNYHLTLLTLRMFDRIATVLKK